MSNNGEKVLIDKKEELKEKKRKKKKKKKLEVKQKNKTFSLISNYLGSA